MDCIEVLIGNWIKDDHLNRLNILRSHTITYGVENLYDSSTSSITYTRDEYGLRGFFDHPSEVVIETVGGSTTDQRYIDDAETWQAVIQNEFASAGKVITKMIYDNAHMTPKGAEKVGKYLFVELNSSF